MEQILKVNGLGHQREKEAMRFQIKKLLEGYDPADLMEQSMYCFGSDDPGAGGTGDDSQSMGIDDSVAAQSAVSGDTSTVGDDSFDDSTGISSQGIGLDAFGGAGGAASSQSTAGMQSTAGDMLGGSMSITDPNTGMTTSYSPTQVPDLELMSPINFDPFNMQNKINNILKDRDARGLYTQVTRDDLGNITGAFDTNNVLGFDVTTYTGLDDNPYNEDRTGMDGMDGNGEIVPPITNPLTGTSRCPDGYKFDEDLQACRMDNKSKFNNQATPSGELFFRQTALDNAPSNLPGGFDFDAANKRFTQSFAYNPSFYNRPMNITGFTPFSSFKPFS